MNFTADDIVDRISRRLADRGMSFRRKLGMTGSDPSDRLIKTVMDRLKSSHPADPALRQFEGDPDKHALWVVEALSAEMESDADFKARVRELMRQVDADAEGLPDAVGRVTGGRSGYAGGNQPPDRGGGYAGGNTVPDAAEDAGFEAYGPPPGPITIPEKPE